MIKYLSGLDVQGNIDLNNNLITEVVIDNQTSDPAGIEGKIYFNTATDKLRLFANGAWADFQTGSDGDTTYDLEGVGAANGTAGVRLKGSDGTNDDVLIVGAGHITVTRSANTLTVTGNDTTVGTVTNVLSGDGISITGTSTVTPTVNIDYSGSDNAILFATTGVPVGADTVWFSDAGDSTIKKSLISAMPGFGKDGTVTNIASGAGLTGGPITASGTLEVDYAGADNIILAGGDGSAVTVVGADKLLISDATDSNAKYVTISQITDAVGGGTVTSIELTAGSLIDLSGTNPITTSGIIDISVDLSELTTSITSGDAYYFPVVNSSNAQFMMQPANIRAGNFNNNLNWTDNLGTVTTIALGADNGAGTPITVTGNITVLGGTNITTSITGQAITINSTDQFVGTVTSVTAGLGLTQSGTSTVNPTILVDYGANGIIGDATDYAGNVEGADQFLVSDNSASNVVRRASISDVPLNVLGVPIANLDINSKKLINVLNPTLAQDGATKHYVDTALAGSGSLIYQGGYNAATNTPNLDATPTITINKGFTYTVTVEGLFYTEQVRVGDLIIAEVNAPTSLADWTTVQNNIDLASTTTVGIASFSSSNFAVSAAGEVTVKNGGIILGTETTGSYNPTVGTSANVVTNLVDVIDTLTLTNGVITAASTRTLPTASLGAVGVIELATQAEVDAGTDALRAVTPATLASHTNGNSWSGSYPLTNLASWTILASVHGLGTTPKIIQTYNSSGDQVHIETQVAANGDVAMTSTNVQLASTITCVIMKVR
jgi:hypothetical protein